MPVGPRGVQAPSAQLLCAIASSGLASPIILASGHLVRARNKALESALIARADRIIWLDSDVTVSLHDLNMFVARAETSFALQENVAWVAGICIRRGGPDGAAKTAGAGINFQYDAGTLWAGLGLQYWHMDRYRLAGAPLFRWEEPLSEDYRMCDDLARAGMIGIIDDDVPTIHDGLLWHGTEME